MIGCRESVRIGLERELFVCFDSARFDLVSGDQLVWVLVLIVLVLLNMNIIAFHEHKYKYF